MTEISVSSRLILFCVLFCLLGGAATAQILELEGDLRLQEQNGVVYVAPNQSTFEPFDRQVHIALHYGVAEKNFYGNEDAELDSQDFDMININAYFYGEYFGLGAGLSYYMESENQYPNVVVVNDSLNTKASILALDMIVGVRFPVHFMDIFLNTGVTLALFNLDEEYMVNGTKTFSESISQTGAGVFAEAGTRLYITRNMNITASARYTSMETSPDILKDERAYDLGGASFLFGLGYAF